MKWSQKFHSHCYHTVSLVLNSHSAKRSSFEIWSTASEFVVPGQRTTTRMWVISTAIKGVNCVASICLSTGSEVSASCKHHSVHETPYHCNNSSNNEKGWGMPIIDICIGNKCSRAGVTALASEAAVSGVAWSLEWIMMPNFNKRDGLHVQSRCKPCGSQTKN